jgi:hypothetical protein
VRIVGTPPRKDFHSGFDDRMDRPPLSHDDMQFKTIYMTPKVPMRIEFGPSQATRTLPSELQGVSGSGPRIGCAIPCTHHLSTDDFSCVIDYRRRLVASIGMIHCPVAIQGSWRQIGLISFLARCQLLEATSYFEACAAETRDGRVT